MWAKIKCWLGFCTESQEIKMREILAVDTTYKVQPKVMNVTIKEPKFKGAISIPKVVIEKTTKKVSKTKAVKVGKITELEIELKVQEAKKAPINKLKADVEKNIRSKVSRSWYNNKKTQKLCATDEVAKLPKTWTKGKLPKETKGVK